MTKMVIVVDDSHLDAATVARDLAAIPGVSVTSQSDAFIDVNALAKGSLAKLRSFAEHNDGVSLHPVAESELMEPIGPSKFL